SVDELIASIEDEGYRVISESDYVAFSFFKEEELDGDDNENNQKEEKPKDKKKDKDADKKKDKDNDNKKSKDDTSDKKDKDKNKDDKDDDVIKHTFTTDEGVVSQEIADILVDEKIIDDRQEFIS